MLRSLLFPYFSEVNLCLPPSGRQDLRTLKVCADTRDFRGYFFACISPKGKWDIETKVRSSISILWRAVHQTSLLVAFRITSLSCNSTLAASAAAWFEWILFSERILLHGMSRQYVPSRPYTRGMSGVHFLRTNFGFGNRPLSWDEDSTPYHSAFRRPAPCHKLRKIYVLDSMMSADPKSSFLRNFA